MAIDPITAALDFGGKILDKFFPDPTQRAQAQMALIKLQQSGELAQMANDTDLAKVAEADRDSARQREVAVKDNTPRILSALVVGGYMFVQWYLLTHIIATEMREIVMRMLGVLDSALTMVLAYYFGSSSSSRTKDETISKLTE